MSQPNFTWIPFYMEFAEQLLTYKENRQGLIKTIKEIYKEINLPLPTLERDNDITDIDPFTVFGLFNKGITTENRLAIIGAFKRHLNMKGIVPTDFDGVPFLQNLNATFYTFNDEREEHDIEQLWGLYKIAIDYAKNKTEKNKEFFILFFDSVLGLKGIGVSKLTMALFWIAPQTYLNLDSRMVWYITETNKLPEKLVEKLPALKNKLDGETYLAFTEIIKSYTLSNDSVFKNFPELSFEAWRYSDEVNQKEKAEKKAKNKQSEQPYQSRYWIYAPGPQASKWEAFYEDGIMAIEWGELGDLSQYTSKDAIKSAMQEIYGPEHSYMNDALALWQFSHEVKVGDVVFVKKGKKEILGRGVVTSEYIYSPEAGETFVNVIWVSWTHKGSWAHPGDAVVKTLTDITPYPEYIEKLNALFNIKENPEPKEEHPKKQPYTKADFLKEVYIDEDRLSDLKAVLENKKNLILKGAPGVGKTFISNRLAYLMMGEKDTSRVQMIQFHQSYSYEDFIEGYRPKADGEGFELKQGPFVKFAKMAENDSDRDYFFIIDEINRGNMSKIFGELMMLIEPDQRGQHINLLYSNESFSVPENLYIVGMMNTADRSLAMLDYALRRRFSFFEMEPAFENGTFQDYINGLENARKTQKVIEEIKALNGIIKEELGSGFQIGHSYFAGEAYRVNADHHISRVVEYEIIPQLYEYWFDDEDKAEGFATRLRSICSEI